MGALQLQSASKGVFITTSVFTKDATASAERARGTIVLVEGALLTSLMMDHGVAVSHKALRIPKSTTTTSKTSDPRASHHPPPPPPFPES